MSKTLVWGERKGEQTMLVLPLDQVFSVGIYSHKNQKIQVSYVEFSAEKFQGIVRYIYLDDYDEGEYYLEVFDPEKEREYSAEDLQAMGVLVVEPWSKEIVYSPTAIMRLENDGIPHPSPGLLFSLIALILVLFILLLIWIIVGFIRIIRKILKKLPYGSGAREEPQ